MFIQPLYLLVVLLTVIINYFLPVSRRYFFLLIVSLGIIDSFNTVSLVILIISAGVNYFIASKLYSSANRNYYYAGVCFNCFAIFLFNYFISIDKQFNLNFIGVSFNINALVLALGLSFYSIQLIAYLTDIYKRRLHPETNFLKYLFCVSFFPKVISGPICRFQDLLPQINENEISTKQLCRGLNQFLLGVLKKLVIADRIAPSVNSIYDHQDVYPGITVLFGAALFTIQLYFDFSGYSDMAIGIAGMLGFNIDPNFKMPFRSASVTEFWRRWHISLISFFTTYVYYPISFRYRKHKKAAAYIGIFFTFLISGLWHGVGLVFLFWATCHFFYLSFELATKKIRHRLSQKLPFVLVKSSGILITFTAVCFSNIFFRSVSFSSAIENMNRLFMHFIPSEWFADVLAPLAVGGQQAQCFNFTLTLFFAFVYLFFEKKIEQVGMKEKISPVFIYITILMITLFGVLNSGERFIYMQF